MRDEELIKSLKERLEKLSGRVTVILTHSGGDPDSIGAAFVLARILKSILNVSTIFKVPAEVSTHSKSF